MRKKMLTVAATAAALSLVGLGASAAAMPADTTTAEATASDPVVDSIVAMAPGGKVTLTFDSPNQTIELGQDVTLSFTGTNATGNPNPDVIVVLDGCGAEAVATPGSWDDVFTSGTLLDAGALEFTITGLTTPGTCSVTVQSNHGGSNFDTTGSDTVTIIVIGGPTTTTPAEETTTTQADSAVPVAGGNSGALAVMALGFVLVGYATIAATRRRRTA
ncbi:MAG: hypothetical protein ACKOYG_03770, partial [Ilumatobacteraceae bacterium]